MNRSKEQGFQLVDRRNLEELVKEWKLGMFGYVDSASAVAPENEWQEYMETFRLTPELTDPAVPLGTYDRVFLFAKSSFFIEWQP